MKEVLVVFLVWITSINLFAFTAFHRFNLTGDTAYNWTSRYFLPARDTDFFSLHERWDSYWYLDIAEHGYSFHSGDSLSNVAFFPLYPFLIRISTPIFFGQANIAGWFISAVSLLLVLIYFYKLIKRFHPNINPHLVLVFLLLFPTAFFLNAIYTESLFLFLSIAAFYYMFSKNLLLSGIFGFLASVTRPSGVYLFIPLLWEYYRQNSSIRALFRKESLFVFLTPLGFAVTLLIDYLLFRDPLLFFKVEGWWGRGFNLRSVYINLFSQPSVVNFACDVSFFFFAAAAAYFLFKNIRTSYGLYVLVTILPAIASGTLLSIGRYILVLFPIYILLASIKNKYIQALVLFNFSLYLAMFTTLFVNYYWTG